MQSDFYSYFKSLRFFIRSQFIVPSTKFIFFALDEKILNSLCNKKVFEYQVFKEKFLQVSCDTDFEDFSQFSNSPSPNIFSRQISFLKNSKGRIALLLQTHYSYCCKVLFYRLLDLKSMHSSNFSCYELAKQKVRILFFYCKASPFVDAKASEK